MTTDKERIKAANEWNDMHISFLIEYKEDTKRVLESFESLGAEACDLIDSQITELECLRSDYRMED